MEKIENANNIEILGMVFQVTNSKHADKRAENCRRSFHNLQDALNRLIKGFKC